MIQLNTARLRKRSLSFGLLVMLVCGLVWTFSLAAQTVQFGQTLGYFPEKGRIVVMERNQPRNKPPEPELYLDFASANQTSKLQRPRAEEYIQSCLLIPGLIPLISFNNGPAGLAYKDVSSYIKVRKKASSFRIGAQDKVSFVLKAFNNSRPSSGEIKLFQFIIDGREREYKVGKYALCMLASSDQLSCKDFVPEQGLPVTVITLADSSYGVSPTAPLDRGEYAITLGKLLFTFGVGNP